MSGKKARVTVRLDRAIIDAGNAAVAAGRAESLGAWINLALAAHLQKAHLEKEPRLQGLAALIADYEAEHGVITDAELAAQARKDRRNAIVVRRSTRVRASKRRTKAT